MSNRTKLSAAAATALALFSLPALANEPSLSPFAAQLGASYTDRSSDWTINSNFGSDTMAAEAALLYRLDQNLNLQIDYAYHEHDFDDGYTFDIWHVGGGIFSRDANFMVGLTGQAGKAGSESGSFAKHFLIGPIMEAYQDNITFGARANYSHLEYNGNLAMKSVAGSLYAKLYASSNLALTLTGDYAGGEIESTNWTTYGGSAEAEYAYGSASVFLRAQYFKSESDSSEMDDTQAVVGLRLYLNSDDTSIMSLHRSTTINNTNELMENTSFPG